MSTLQVMFKSQSVDWPTPQAVYDELDREFKFTFDPCPLQATGDQLSELSTSWKGQRVFCNPPYGPQITDFLKRWGEADLAVFLIPARTDTKWFHNICLPHAKEIRFVKGRLKFGGAKYNAPFPSMIVVFGEVA
jgi:hypothetical protein